MALRTARARVMAALLVGVMTAEAVRGHADPLGIPPETPPETPETSGCRTAAVSPISGLDVSILADQRNATRPTLGPSR